MKFFGNYSTFEVDVMLPLEREIKFSLLAKSIEDKNK
jgi:hypothetical protein